MVGCQVPRDSTEQERIGDPVGHRVEERTTDRRCARRLCDWTVEEVGKAGREEQEDAGEEVARAHDHCCDHRHDEPERGDHIGGDVRLYEDSAHGLRAAVHGVPPAAIEHSKAPLQLLTADLSPRAYHRHPSDQHLMTIGAGADRLRRRTAWGAVDRPREVQFVPSHPPSRIRNVALVGHNGAGKTTLAEALLARTGAIPRQGRIEDGTTVSDFEPEEIKRHMSVSLAMAPFSVGDIKVNLIDTPGYADFFGEVRAACSVVDLVVVVVSAVEGVEAQTEAAWRLASELGLPRLVFVNKLDRERASFDRTLADLRQKFGAGIAPLELPVGEESAFRGIADLLTDSAILYEGGSPTTVPIPDDLADVEHQVREQLVEGIIVSDNT